ncbi:MAG: glycerophosphoryl diester phosphodiesterase membrane domain-containing protein [Zunongwangia sp.]|uniref:glycerophosphoryl diester phosphodiesterase membrane domain-containing protein n=1 Tax=Zunongwangia sp. TaxID=1965325 RepID=UPI003241E90F
MENNIFRFRKTRDFGELLSDTFKFLRENGKSFLSINFKICAPFFIALILTNAYYTYVTLGMGFESYGNLTGFLIPAFINLIAVFVYITALYLSVFNYIKSYIANNGVVSEDDIKNGLKKDLGSGLAVNLIVGILIFTGLLFILIPGIYLGVVLTLALPILVFEQKGVGDTISSCFQLIKDNWWFTFGALIVFGIIMYLINVVFQMPMIIYMIVGMISGLDAGVESMAESMQSKDPILMILTILASIAQYLLYIITPIFISLIYFNLHEEKNFTGTFENIDRLGEDRE